eukprot:2943355-Rhodomonas_salina.1
MSLHCDMTTMMMMKAKATCLNANYLKRQWSLGGVEQLAAMKRGGKGKESHGGGNRRARG